MTNLRKSLVTLTAAALALCASASSAQSNYPNKVIRIVSPFPAGGSTDAFARAIAQRLIDAWGQGVVVDTRTGANGIVATDIVAKSTPDGHTLLMNAIGHAANASLYPKLPYDTLRDFTPVIPFADVPVILAVHPKLKVNSVAELITRARTEPGKIDCAAGGVGASHHLAAELFRIATKIEWQYIQYRGGNPALLDLIGGKVDLMFTPVSTSIQHVKAGRLKALGVTSPQRVALVPDVPTIAEAGVPGYESRAWYGLIGPAKMDKGIVAKLNAEINRALQDTPFREKVLTAQGAVPMGGSADEFAAFLKKEVAKYAEVVKTSGMRGEGY